jgi:hypothetical protein
MCGETKNEGQRDGILGKKGMTLKRRHFDGLKTVKT